jgi:PAS domain S-box-containing protein
MSAYSEPSPRRPGRMRIGLRAKITLIAGGITLLAIGAIIASSDRLFIHAYTHALESRSLAIGKSLSVQLERLLQLGIRVENLTGFEEQCQEIVRAYPGIEYAMVVSRDGDVLFHSDSKRIGDWMIDPALLRALKKGDERAVRYAANGAGMYAAVVPAFGPGGTQSASVLVAFSASLITDRARQMALSNVGVGLFFLTAGIVVLVATLSIFVTRPLGRLIGAVEQVQGTRADSALRVNIASRDEIGRLATVFNDMTRRLGELVERERYLAAAAATAKEQARRAAELEQAVTAANKARDQIERIFASMSDGFYALDDHWRFSYLNLRAEKILGRSREALIGRCIWEEYPAAKGTIVYTEYHRALAERANVEFQVFYPPTKQWYEVRAFPHGHGLAVYIRDVTEKIETEERLRQAQKMEAVGQLTGGIAHDFNNLLTVIVGNSETLLEGSQGDDSLRKAAEMVHKAAERAAGLTHHLLAFGRRQTLAPKPTDVNALLVGMEKLLGRTLGEPTDIKFVQAAGVWKAMIDPNQLENAILNLAINSRDAMPKGGKLTIETANVTIHESYADRGEAIGADDYVMVAVSDTGTGMTPEVLARAFEPFFTTKDVGKGTGMGLAMVYGFVKQSKGHVKLYSEPGEGTTVKLYLPRAVEDTARIAEEKAMDAVPTGRETVFLVEDDPLVRENTEAQLRSLGYTVTAVAGSGPEAIKRIEGGVKADLLLTDVVLPDGMNGRQVADAVRGRLPGIKVLYMSGYTEHAVMHQGCLEPGIRLLSKPFRKHELAQALRAVLDQAA